MRDHNSGAMRSAMHWHRRFFRLANRVSPDVHIARTDIGVRIVVTVPSCMVVMDTVLGKFFAMVPSAQCSETLTVEATDAQLFRTLHYTTRRALAMQGRDER